jgi:hypothetical protein
VFPLPKVLTSSQSFYAIFKVFFDSLKKYNIGSCSVRREFNDGCPLLRIRATPGPALRILRYRPKDWMRSKNAEYINFSGGKASPTEARTQLKSRSKIRLNGIVNINGSRGLF